jgi:hypothetical protein
MEGCKKEPSRIKVRQTGFLISEILCAYLSFSCAGQDHKSQISRRSPNLELSQQVPPGQMENQETDALSENQKDPNGHSSPKVTSSGDGTHSDLPGTQNKNGGDKDATSEPLVPILYDGFFYPLKMKECHEAGKIYDRSTLNCHVTQILGTPQNGLTCNKAGIIMAFGNTPALDTNIDTKLNAGWRIDQCAFEGPKKIVYFVCFANQSETCSSNPRCEDPKNLEPKNTKFCVAKISEN